MRALLPDPFPEQVKYGIDDDPNYPYVTLVLAPSQVMPLVEMTKLMAIRYSFDTDPAKAKEVADRILVLLRAITDLDTGAASMIPDDMFEL